MQEVTGFLLSDEPLEHVGGTGSTSEIWTEVIKLFEK